MFEKYITKMLDSEVLPDNSLEYKKTTAVVVKFWVIKIFCNLKHDGYECFSLECKIKQKITLIDALTGKGRGQSGETDGNN